MLFKELLAPAVTAILLAPFLQRKVFGCALDNAGAAFTLNKLTCRCPRCLELLRPLADSLSRYHMGLIAGHAHRCRNAHTDELSHSLSHDLWSQIIAKAPRKKLHRMEIHFIVVDLERREARAATISFKRPSG